MPIQFPVAGASTTPGLTPASAGTGAAGAEKGLSFGESLAKLTNAVESTASTANNAVANMLDGSGDVHDAMIALQQAETTLQLTVQMRNKFVQAYQDIMRMPV